MPTCSVIIVNWNSWDFLFPCLDALYQQTFQDFRVIVVDNNSTEKSHVALLDKYPRLLLIQNETNAGFAAANNQAILKSADCRWIVLLNPDTLPDANWLEKLQDAARAHSQYAFFGSLLLSADTRSKIDGMGDIYHMSGLAWRAGHGVAYSQKDVATKEIFSPCAAAAMYKRDALLSVGCFDEDFFCYMEDIDLGFRLRLAGHKALAVPDSVVLHYGSGTTEKQSDFSVYHGHRNLVWTGVKNLPISLLILFFPAHLLYTVACIFLYVSRGQGKVIFRAKWAAIMGLKKAWQKREEIHSQRAIQLRDLWRTINKNLYVGPTSKYRG